MTLTTEPGRDSSGLAPGPSEPKPPIPGPPNAESDEARPSALGLFAAVVAFLLPVLYSPSVASRYWIPRYALMMVAAGVGLALLLGRPPTALRSATWAARIFLVAALLSTLFSENIGLAIGGRWNQGTGFLFLLAAVGSWSVGTRLTRADTALLEKALLVAVGMNVVAAIVAMAFNVGRFGLENLYGRAMGLLGNPVHLGPLVVAGICLVVARVDKPVSLYVAALAPMGVAVALAGSPAAVAFLAIPLLWAVVRKGWRVAFAAAAAIVFGILLAPAFERPVERVSPTIEQEAGETVAISAANDRAFLSTFTGRAFGPRLETWEAAGPSLQADPLIGVGPGMYGEATIDDRDIEVAQEYPNAVFNDAHNILVEFSVTLGLVGLVTFSAWLVLAGKRARGPLALVALVIGLAHLYQPQHIATAIPALLALGAAARPAVHRRLSRVTTSSATALGTLGALAAGAILFGAFRLDQARLDFGLSDVRIAQRLLPFWAEPYRREALIHQFSFITGEGHGPAARLALRRAIAREPANFELYYRYADVAMSHGLLEEARPFYERSLEINPFATNALLGLVRLELAQTQDLAAARRWLARALTVNPSIADVYQLVDDDSLSRSISITDSGG